MKKLIQKSLFLVLATGVFSMASCITIYGSIEKEQGDKLSLFKASCSGYGCIDGRELLCDVEANGNLSCVDLAPAYTKHNTVGPIGH